MCTWPSFPSAAPHKLGVGAHFCDLSTLEAKARGSVRPCLKNLDHQQNGSKENPTINKKNHRAWPSGMSPKDVILKYYIHIRPTI